MAEERTIPVIIRMPDPWKSFFLILLCWMAFGVQAQTFSFGTANSNTKIVYNKKLKPLLDKQDYNQLRALIKKDPGVVDQASVMVAMRGRYVSSKEVPKPVLHDVADGCMEGKYPVALLDFFLEQGSDPYIDYEGLPVLYRVMDYLATHPTSACADAIGVFHTLSSSGKVDLTRHHRDYPPPFAYLMRENLAYLKGTYQSGYIPEEVIKAFIEAGASTNTLDQQGSSPLIYAIQTNNESLQAYLLNQGAEVERVNKQGRDALYYVVSKNDLSGVKNLIKGGYLPTPAKLEESGIASLHGSMTAEITGYIAQASIPYLTNPASAVQFLNVFPGQSRLILENPDVVSKVLLPYTKSVVPFVNHIEKKGIRLTEKEKQQVRELKVRYINQSGSLDGFVASLSIFPLIPVAADATTNFNSEQASGQLRQGILNAGSWLDPGLKARLLQEMDARTEQSWQNRFQASGEAVWQYINLKKDFPSRTAEIEQACFNQLFYAEPHYHSYRWLTQAYEETTRIKNYIRNCEEYLGAFSYQRDKVAAYLAMARPLLAEGQQDQEDARALQNRLFAEGLRVVKEIETQGADIPYRMSETKQDGRFTYYWVRAEGLTSNGIGVVYNRESGKYCEDGLFHSNCENGEPTIQALLRAWALEHNLHTNYIKNDRLVDYDRLESFLEQYRKYDLKEWYRIRYY